MHNPPRINLVGKKFGKLTVIQYVRDANNQGYWECRCDCGKSTFVKAGNLLSGNTKSCGCTHHKEKEDIIGKRFGNLVVLERGEDYVSDDYRAPRYKCLCDCGKTCLKRSYNLRKGISVDCGRHAKEKKEPYAIVRHTSVLEGDKWLNHISITVLQNSNMAKKCFYSTLEGLLDGNAEMKSSFSGPELQQAFDDLDFSYVSTVEKFHLKVVYLKSGVKLDDDY